MFKITVTETIFEVNRSDVLQDNAFQQYISLLTFCNNNAFILIFIVVVYNSVTVYNFYGS